MDNDDSPRSSPSSRNQRGRGLQLSISLGAPTLTVGGLFGQEVQNEQMTLLQGALLIMLWLVSIPVVHFAQSRFALRRRGIKRAGRLISRLRLKRRARSAPNCELAESAIRDDKVIRAEALEALHDINQSDLQRRRVVHTLIHGRSSDGSVPLQLEKIIGDQYLPEAYRFNLAVDIWSCDSTLAIDVLDTFSRDSSNSCCTRFDAALLIEDADLKTRAVLAIAKGSEADESCRFEAALVLNAMGSRYAASAFQAIVGDARNVSFQVRIAGAIEWAALDRADAIDALWKIALGKDVPWPWRITAAARLSLLRVRAAYDLLQDGLVNPKLPPEVRTHIRMTLVWLDSPKTT